MTKLPPSGAGDFAEQFPEAWGAYEALGKACAQSGPLDARTRRLIKLALSIGERSEGAVHSHARQAMNEGMTSEELRRSPRSPSPPSASPPPWPDCPGSTISSTARD